MSRELSNTNSTGNDYSDGSDNETEGSSVDPLWYFEKQCKINTKNVSSSDGQNKIKPLSTEETVPKKEESSLSTEETVQHTEESLPNKDNETGKSDKIAQEDENKLGGSMFCPPLYIQRYRFVVDSLAEFDVESILDIGCSECTIIRHLPDNKTVKHIGLLDLDLDTLLQHKFSIQPPLYRYINRRSSPLKVQLFHGDATKLDQRMCGYDAVTMVEFIEHLYDDDFQEVMKMVFRGINPRIVVVTTPNYDFNTLFSDKGTGMKFRHTDHKFEWTRQEFRTWGDGISDQYGYYVAYSGVGMPPSDKTYLGFCSQAAVFERKEECVSTEPLPEVFQDLYSLVAEAEYPYKESNQSQGQEIKMEIEYWLRSILKQDKYTDEDSDVGVVPLTELIKHKKIANLCSTDVDILRQFLKEGGFQLTLDSDSIIVQIDDYVYGNDRGWSDDEIDQSEWTTAVWTDTDMSCDIVTSEIIEEESWD